MKEETEIRSPVVNENLTGYVSHDQNLSRILLRASVLSVLNQSVRMGTALISVPLLVGYLGKERYGLWLITLSTLTIVTFFDVGFMPTIKNRMTEAFGNKDEKSLMYFTSGSIIFGFLILVLGFSASLLIPLIDWADLFKVTDPVGRAEVTRLVLIVYLLGITALALSCVEGIYVARMEIVKTQIYATGGALFSFGMILLGIWIKASLPTLALLIMSSSTLYRLVLLVELSLGKRKLILIGLKDFFTLVRDVFPSSIAFVGIKSAELIMFILPNLIITRVLNLSDVAMFGVGFRLATIPLTLVTAILPVFWPVFTLAFTRGDKVWVRSYLAKAITVTSICIVIYGIAISVFGPIIIDWWTRSMIVVSRQLLSGLALLVIVQAITYWLSTFLHSISEFRFQFWCHAITVVIFILFCGPMAQNQGLLGVSLILSASWGLGCMLPMGYRVRAILPSRVDGK